MASTFIGGAAGEEGKAIALDSFGSVFVTGFTTSINYPTRAGAFDTSNPLGSTEVFVSKLDSSLSNLVASTFIGGSGGEGGSRIAVIGLGVFVTGSTKSSNYPTTAGAYDSSFNGSTDVFVSRLTSELAAASAKTLSLLSLRQLQTL